MLDENESIYSLKSLYIHSPYSHLCVDSCQPVHVKTLTQIESKLDVKRISQMKRNSLEGPNFYIIYHVCSLS